MATVNVRYITDDVDAAVAFYVERLGFEAEMHPGPGFAVLSRGDLRLLLNRPGAGGAGQPMPDSRMPESGGWNRIQIEVSDLKREVAALHAAGASFRGEIVTGRGGSQILLDDPAATPSSCFSPPATEHWSSNPGSEGRSNRCHPRRNLAPTSCCAARRPAATCP